jgi:YD repeat-containing protein
MLLRKLAGVAVLLAVLFPEMLLGAGPEIPRPNCQYGSCQGTITTTNDPFAAGQEYCTVTGPYQWNNPNMQCPCSGGPCSRITGCSVSIPGGTPIVLVSGTDNFNLNWARSGGYISCQCPAGTTSTASGSCACPAGTVTNGSACLANCGSQSPFLGFCTGANKYPKSGGSPPNGGTPAPPECCKVNQTGDPIKVADGDRFQREPIFSSPTLKLVLSYIKTPPRYLPKVPYPFGDNWFFNYGMTVFIADQKVGVARADGKFLEFTTPVSGNVYVGDPDISDTLEKIVSGVTTIGWKYTVAATDTVETYDAAGLLTQIQERNGQTWTLTYSTGSTPPSVASKAGLLITVTDPFGRTINFTYDGANRIVSMTDPAGNPYRFKYDEASAYRTGGGNSNLLTSVKFPDSGKRIYYYNEPAYMSSGYQYSSLTGIGDENGARYAIFKYDGSNRGISSELADGVAKYISTYNVNGTTSVTDPLGAISTYTSQISHGVPRTTGISGTTCPSCGPAAISYDANGFISSQTDWNGNVTTYTRADPNNRLDLETSRTEASGSGVARTIGTTWHSTFRLPTLIAESGRTTAFTYDGNGNMLTKTVTDTATSAARAWTYTYNANGKVLTVDGPRTDVSDVTTYTYYANNDSNVGKRGNVNTITNALSQVTTINTYDTNGRPLTITDPNGLVTTLGWHPRGWLASRTLGAEKTAYDYDYVGQLTRVTLPDSSFLQYSYDNAHRLTQVADGFGNKVVYTLDNMGNRTQEDVKDPSNVLKQTRSRVFNSLNQLVQVIGGASPSTQITTYAYDNQGNLTTVTDPLSHVTTNTYDALNRLVQITYPMSGVTKFTLNSRDQLTVVTDPRNNDTTYTVNALDDVSQQVSPDTGTTARTFDAAGNVLTSTNAKNQVTTNTYDALNRITQANYHDNSKVEYGYDAGTYGKGRLTSLTEKDPVGTVITTTSYAYDIQGRLLTDTRVISGVSYVTGYSFDSYGRLNGVTYPSGRIVAYSFDASGRIYGMTTTPPAGSPQTVVSNVTYHPFGQVKGYTYGNAQVYSRTIDLDGRISAFTLDGTLMSIVFDAASRITGQTYFPVPTNSVTYGYDDRDWLTSTVTPAATFGFTYDANGNRTSKTIDAMTWNYAYPGNNNKLSSITDGGTQTFTHDANGSITSDGTNFFTYDTRGRMTATTTGLGSVTYGLNALGQRYAKTVGGVTTIFHYDKDGKLIAESTPLGVVSIEYLYLGDIPVGGFK